MSIKPDNEKINLVIPTELKDWASVQAQMEYISLSALIRKSLLIYLKLHGYNSDVILDSPSYEPPKNLKR